MIFDLHFKVWLRPLGVGGIDGPTLTGSSFHDVAILRIAQQEESRSICA